MTKTLALRNIRTQHDHLVKELTTTPNKIVVFRDMDKLQGLFYVTRCDYRRTHVEGDHLVHKCIHSRNVSCNCGINECPLR